MRASSEVFKALSRSLILLNKIALEEFLKINAVFLNKNSGKKGGKKDNKKDVEARKGCQLL